MKPDRAWVRLGSGRQLEQARPQPLAWTDENFAALPFLGCLR